MLSAEKIQSIFNIWFNCLQVLKLRIELLSMLAQNSVFSKRSADFCLSELVDKVGDVKNGAAVQDCFTCISEACTLEYTSQKVVEAAFTQKNPKNQAEALNWLSQAIKEFGFKVNMKPMIQYMKKAFAATNPVSLYILTPICSISNQTEI